MTASNVPAERHSVGQLCRLFDLSPRAVRLYEEQGLLPASRDRLNRRCFDRAARHRLGIITALRKAGVGLAEIRRILNHRDEGLAREIERVLDAQAARLQDDLAAITSARQTVHLWIARPAPSP